MKTWAIITFLALVVTGSIGDQPRIKRGVKVTSLSSSALHILKEMYTLWNAVLRNPDQGIVNSILRSREHEILGRITAISHDISRLEQKINGISGETVTNILAVLPKTMKTELGLNELGKVLDEIDLAQDEFRFFVTSKDMNQTFITEKLAKMTARHETTKKEPEDSWTYQDDSENEIPFLKRSNSAGTAKRDTQETEKFTLQNFAAWATGPTHDSIKTLLGRLHRLVVPRNKIVRTGILELFKEQSEELVTMMCNMRESAHQIIYNLYNTVTLAEYKGYTMLQFSYMILKLYEKGDFVSESEREKAKFEKRMSEKTAAARNALANADRSMYNCDPQQYVEGVNFVKLTKLLQGYIENEVNLNPYGTCRENCAYYVYTEYHSCYKEQFCSKQEQCHGKVVECRYVDSDMNICKSTDPERRYDWIEYENGRVLGNKGRCQNRNFFKVDSWWRYLFWHCSYCLCLCDEGNHSSHRHFNLRPVTSDIEQNKVITGVRITKLNKIIHLQIQQAVLSPRGTIDKTTLLWKPVDNYTITDRNARSGIDYHTMNWMDRIVDIDEVFGPSEHALTGIRFRKLGTHLNLEIRSTPFNFTTGQLYPEVHSTWISNDNTEISLQKPRKEIVLTNPDIPIRNGPHIIDSTHDQFIKFQPTSFDSDAAQSTVPFIDSQPITSQGFPLSGFGLIHRGKPGSGGFIAPKLISYNFAEHI